jgi:pilus assembly protein CpaE
MTDILLVAVAPDLAARISQEPGHRVVAIDRDHHDGRLAKATAPEGFRPRVIFVGTSVSIDWALDYARVVIADDSELSVYLVADRNRKLAKTVMAIGMRGVVDERISARDLSRLLSGLGGAAVPQPADDSVPAPHTPQVIVVASPKGGVGKTTTAINVAALIAEWAPGEVVVIDLDLQFGDIATMLDIEPNYTISDAFASGVDDSMRLRTLLVSHPSNFYVLCASADPSANGRVTGDQIRKLVHQYAATFRYVIVDTPAGILEETLAGLEEATDVVFVAALDIATLRAVRREIEVLAELSLLPQRRYVVLNRADRQSGVLERDAERIVGLPINAVVPTCDRVRLCANRGEVAVASRRRNPVRQPFRELARSVSDTSAAKGRHTR